MAPGGHALTAAATPVLARTGVNLLLVMAAAAGLGVLGLA